MTATIIGVCADRDGLERRGGVAWATPSAEITIRADSVPILDGRDRVVGKVVHAERVGSNLWLVAEAAELSDEVRVQVGPEVRSIRAPQYWSIETLDGPPYELVSATATAFPTRAGARAQPLRFLPGGLAERGSWTGLNHFEKEIIGRAAETAFKWGRPLRIHDEAGGTAAVTTPEPLLEYRSAEFNVSPGRREILALCCPYEQPAHVVIKGRAVREVLAAGSFDGVATQGNTVRLNMDHMPERVVGKAVEFITGRSEGLIATFRIARTVSGDEALEMASTDLVDCSVGFGVVKESWPRHDLRRVHEGYLDHVALTSSPAYAAAKVLSVRGDLAGVR